MSITAAPDYFEAVVGQESVVAQLRANVDRPVHAYLFAGPPGAGKFSAAYAFAAALLDDPRPLSGTHPDVHVVEREGASISVVQAREIIRLASLSPLEGARKVLILDDFHLVADAAPALLKTIEEASTSTTFIILAESIPKELVTVASRCVVVDFRSVSPKVIEDTLISEGVAADRAAVVAQAAFGDLDRARLLATDDSVIARHQLWVDALHRLDGTGSAAAEIALEVIAAIDAASAHLVEQHESEVLALKAQIDAGTASNSAIKALDTAQKRQLRRLRMDELRSGLATIAQELGRKLQLAADERAVRHVQAGLTVLQQTNEALQFNPNEALLLHGLFVKLSQSAQS